MPEKTTLAHNQQVVTITPLALNEIKKLMAEGKEKGFYLRLGVSADGCSGISYMMAFESAKREFDREFDFDGVKVLVDLKALMYLAGATLDYKSDLCRHGFTLESRNAAWLCGCSSRVTSIIPEPERHL